MTEPRLLLTLAVAVVLFLVPVFWPVRKSKL